MGDCCARCAASQRPSIVKQSFVAVQRLQPPLREGRSRGRPLRALRRVATLQHFQTIFVLSLLICCTRMASEILGQLLGRTVREILANQNKRKIETGRTPPRKQPSYRENQPVPWYLRVHQVHLFDALRRVRPATSTTCGSPRGRTNNSKVPGASCTYPFAQAQARSRHAWPKAGLALPP